VKRAQAGQRVLEIGARIARVRIELGGGDIEEREYPELEPEDIRQVLEYAAASLEGAAT
jgi:hypothetical protein